MGLFSEPKCKIHKTPLKIGKNYMCQLYYFCSKCRAEKQASSDKDAKIIELEKRLKDLENKK